MVQGYVESFFGKAPRKDVNPDEAVAAGAAIQGDVLGGGRTDVLLLDVTPLSLGIETMGGIMSKVITKNTTIPTKSSQVFSTAEDNQPAVTIRVFQGEREMAQHNKLLGEFSLDGIPPAARGTPQIEVTFDVDVNGILKVSAKDKVTGKSNNITIKANSGLTEAEIAQMVADAEANADADKKQRELVEARNAAEHQLWGVEKNMKEHGDKLSEEQVEEISKAIAEVRGAIAGEDADKIQETLVETAPKFMPLYDVVGQATAEQQQKDTDQAKAEKPQDETVVDADFTEVKDSK
jgi:molecular chaperone DnaK